MNLQYLITSLIKDNSLFLLPTDLLTMHYPYVLKLEDYGSADGDYFPIRLSSYKNGNYHNAAVHAYVGITEAQARYLFKMSNACGCQPMSLHLAYLGFLCSPLPADREIILQDLINLVSDVDIKCEVSKKIQTLVSLPNAPWDF